MRTRDPGEFNRKGERIFRSGKFIGVAYADAPEWYIESLTRFMPIVSSILIRDERERQIQERLKRGRCHDEGVRSQKGTV